jgi:serine/threonine-protein kinase
VSSSERLGRYRVGERIGEGGMGEVFRGEIDGAEGFSKTVAIKRIRATLAAAPHVREAFVAEARLARRLEHGNIVQVYDLGVDGELPYLVVEFVDGVSLAELISAERVAGRRMDIADALYVIEHVAAALDYAHRLTDESGRRTGVVHRDVNPRNILVSREGVVKLADFGIAKALRSPSTTLPGIIKGTLWYLSPEQTTGAAIDARTDQFAVGVLLHELVAGRNPFEETEDIQQYRALLTDGLPPLEGGAADAELAAIVGRATAARPGDRFPSMGALRHELEAWRVAREIRTSPDGIRRKVRSILGEAVTGHAASLDGALADRLGRPNQPRTRAMPAPASPSRLPIAIAAALLLAAAGLAGYLLTRGGCTPAVTAVADAGIVADVRYDAAPPRPVPSEVEQPPDAMPVPSDVEGPPRARKPGRLKINLIPWANVTLGRKRLGRTPVDAEVPSGRHRLILSNPDLGKRATRTVVVPEETTLLVTEW